MDRTHHVDIPHPAEHRWIGFAERTALDRAGVVHEDGDRAASRLGRGHLALDLGGIGHVGEAASGGVACGHGGAQRRLGAADHGHRRAGPGERGRDRAANAAAAAGDESMPACQRHGLDFTPARRDAPDYILCLKFLSFKLADEILYA